MDKGNIDPEEKKRVFNSMVGREAPELLFSDRTELRQDFFPHSSYNTQESDLT